MRISVNVKAQAKEDRIKKTGLNSYAVWVKAKAQEGKANQAVIKVLAEYFDLAKSKVMLVHGKRSKDKIFELCR